VSPKVYSMTATRDAIWTIRDPVGRMRDLPLRRQSAAPRPPGTRGRPFVIECTPQEVVVAVHAQDRRFLEQCGRGPATLLSDAAHPMLASMGQGASSATPDGYALAELLARVPDPVAVLRTCEELRRKRTRVKGLRRLGKLEQTENRLALAARNHGLRLAPTCVLTRQTVRPMWFDMAWTAL
jgi:2-polyprenyl-6-methoxyphenol hydroxylase-like FAD-dependent oxidoreductase